MRNLRREEVNRRLSEFINYKDSEIFAYCKSGHCGGLAQESLVGDGFKRVLDGGGYKSGGHNVGLSRLRQRSMPAR